MFGRDLVGDRIFEPKLDSPWSQQGIDGTSRIALKPSLGEKCQDVDISDQRCRSQRQIADVARSNTDAVEGSRAGRSRDSRGGTQKNAERPRATRVHMSGKTKVAMTS